MASIMSGELILALGPGWFSSAQLMPWNDTRRSIPYIVYSPAYEDEAFLCRFQLGGPVTWWCEQLQMGISSVTHWRIATRAEFESGEHCFRVSPPVATQPDAEALSMLLRWWESYQNNHCMSYSPPEQPKEESFADKLKAFRLAADLTQQELAVASGTTLARVRNYEAGKTKPRYAAIYDFAKALKIPPNFLE